jgi:hypothetical protein
MENLKYPIGHCKIPDKYDPELVKSCIYEISELSEKLKKLITGLSKDDLLKTYRPDGWTVLQVVHHIADSHLNSFIRFKLALT